MSTVSPERPEQEEPEVPEEGATSEQVMHAQDESRAEGDPIEEEE
ncbi:hypothetical protein ACIGXM_20090 [Kitasatospora sp. NPDC052896]